MANQVWARQQQAELRGEAAAARTRAATEARRTLTDVQVLAKEYDIRLTISYAIIY